MLALPKIMIAPNGARKTKADHPALPVTIEDTVMVAKACFEAGANGIHAHIRDEQGRHLLDAGVYRELTSELELQVPDLAVQITTESCDLYSPDQQRQLVRDCVPKAVSIGLREIFSDDKPDVNREFFEWAAGEDIAVQHILYEPSELTGLATLIEAKAIPKEGLQLLFVLGRYTKGQVSDPETVQQFLDAKQANDIHADWGVCAFGAQETASLLKAHSLGGKMRVGFENSFQNADGSRAENNEERVAEIVRGIG